MLHHEPFNGIVENSLVIIEEFKSNGTPKLVMLVWLKLKNLDCYDVWYFFTFIHSALGARKGT